MRSKAQKKMGTQQKRSLGHHVCSSAVLNLQPRQWRQHKKTPLLFNLGGEKSGTRFCTEPETFAKAISERCGSSPPEIRTGGRTRWPACFSSSSEPRFALGCVSNAELWPSVQSRADYSGEEFLLRAINSSALGCVFWYTARR